MDNGKLLRNLKEQIVNIHTTIWANLKRIMLSKKSQTQKAAYVSFHLYDFLEKTKL